jgi:rSAM/selenodomain-associated transferase 1
MMKNKSSTCILLLVKYPENGQVKHRLSPHLNEDVITRLYRCFVHDTLSTIKTIDATLFICYFPPDTEEKFRDWLGSTFLFFPQNGTNLGERMKNCFIHAFAQGFHRVILIGSDSPDLPVTFLHNAFTELRTHEVVLGPSSDGGYYLIGFRDNTFLPSVFEGIPWSQPTVLLDTVKKIQQKNHRFSLLPVWGDIDTIADLKNLVKRNQDTAFKNSQTITYIQQHKILVEDDDAASRKK